MKYFLLSFLFATNILAIELKFYDKFIIDNKEQIKAALIGGLSGACYSQNNLYVISDDRGEHGKPRLFSFSLDLKIKPIKIIPTNVIYLKNTNGRDFAVGDVDFEGITKLLNGNFLLSSEGDNNKTPRIAPQLFKFNAKGILLKRYHLPDKFLPQSIGAISKGVQNNLAFESLTSNIGGKIITIANEAPLLQDIIPGETQFLRILKMKNDQNTLIPMREGLYPIQSLSGNNGLVDIFHLDNDRILTLERSWDPKTRKNKVQIFLVTQDFDNTPNYLNLFSVKNQKIKPLKKSKLIDLDVLIQKSQLKRLDNFEAITLGPPLPNGNSSLIIISDNNFSSRQQTIFLVFEMIN